LPDLIRTRSPAPAEQALTLTRDRTGAELVHLAEALWVRIIRVGFAILIVGCALALVLGTLARGSPSVATSLFVGVAAVFGFAGLMRSHSAYLRLRSRCALQIAPAAFAALAVLLDGPDSPCWWIALPLLWIGAAVCSTMSLAIGSAAVTGVAFLAGTLLGGEALIGRQDAGVLPAAVGLTVYTLLACVLIDGFAGLVLGRRGRGRPARQPTQGPVRLTNLAARMAPATKPARAQPATQRDLRSPSRLTARQLEVTLLLHDGLQQNEIAASLGISLRQVERLVAAARERCGAATTSHLVAMLAGGALEGERPSSGCAAITR